MGESSSNCEVVSGEASLTTTFVGDTMTDTMECKHGEVCQGEYEDERPEISIQDVKCVLHKLHCSEWHVPAKSAE